MQENLSVHNLMRSRPGQFSPLGKRDTGTHSVTSEGSGNQECNSIPQLCAGFIQQCNPYDIRICFTRQITHMHCALVRVHTEPGFDYVCTYAGTEEPHN